MLGDSGNVSQGVDEGLEKDENFEPTWYMWNRMIAKGAQPTFYETRACKKGSTLTVLSKESEAIVSGVKGLLVDERWKPTGSGSRAGKRGGQEGQKGQEAG